MVYYVPKKRFIKPPTHREEQKEKESWNNAIIISYVSEYYFAAESTIYAIIILYSRKWESY